MKKILSLLFILFAVTRLSASTCIALGNGDWESAGTWSCGHAPTCGDSLIIPVGDTISVTAVDNYIGTCVSPHMAIVIYGELLFVTGKKLELPCNSAVYIFPGGIIDPGGGGGSSNLISICNTNYWIAGNGPATGPSCFNCSFALPVRLGSFTTACSNENVTLKWETVSEINNKYFAIERSQDGNSWIQLGNVNGAGTSSVAHYYTWQDAAPLPKTSYYRIKQTDYDGNYTYSPVSSSECGSINHSVSLYPNPSKGDVKFNISSDVDQDITVVITNELGQTIIQYNDKLEQGLNIKLVPVNNLASGVYLMNIGFENDKVTIHKYFVISK